MARKTQTKINSLTPIVNRYLASVESAERSSNTIAAYKQILDIMATYITENNNVQSISYVKGFMVEEFMDSMDGISPKTRNYYIGLIRLFFNYVEKAGYIDKNPADVLQKTKVVVDDDEEFEKVDDKFYTEKELLKLMKKIGGRYATRDKAMVALLSGSGLRASEMCSMTVGTWKNRKKQHVYVKRKGGAKKWVPVAEYVNAYIDSYLEERGVVTDDEPLFITQRRMKMTRTSLYAVLRKHQEKAGIEPGVHIFRHTFLTGTSKVSNEKIAQTLANHSNIQTTKRYIHTTTDERNAAVNNTAWAEALQCEI